MGFITTTNHNGREVFACESGISPNCTQTGCRSHKCPHGWCQRYYFCRPCWEIIKTTWKQKHEKCKVNSAEHHKREVRRGELLNQGKFLRCSALAHDTDGGTWVKVIFRDKGNTEKAFFMKPETYHAIPILTPATIEDFQGFGELIQSGNADIYAGL